MPAWRCHGLRAHILQRHSYSYSSGRGRSRRRLRAQNGYHRYKLNSKDGSQLSRRGSNLNSWLLATTVTQVAAGTAAWMCISQRTSNIACTHGVAPRIAKVGAATKYYGRGPCGVLRCGAEQCDAAAAVYYTAVCSYECERLAQPAQLPLMRCESSLRDRAAATTLLLMRCGSQRNAVLPSSCTTTATHATSAAGQGEPPHQRLQRLQRHCRCPRCCCCGQPTVQLQ